MTPRQPIEHGKIEVKLESVLSLLAEALYSKPDVCVRELLANAVDALHAREHEVRHNGAQAPDELRVRIWYDGAGVLTVEDSGLGMTRDEIVQYLTVIGESGTRILRDRIRDHELVKKLIGQFGIGLLSCFTLAEQVEVLTLSARPGESEGYRWVSDPQGNYELTTVSLPEPGTRVRLRVADPRKRQIVQGDALPQSVRLYGDFLPFPIYDNVGRRLNIQTPPWERAEATDSDYGDYVKHRFGWDPPLFTIPIRRAGDVEMGGIVFIPSEQQFLNRTGAVDLYVKHMLVRQDCPNVFPDYFLCLAGVIECPQLTMIMSREDVMRNSDFERFQRALTSQVLHSLEDLRRKPSTMRGVLAMHGRELRHALLQDERLFKALADAIPFRSGASGRSVTLEEYLAAAARRKDPEEQKRVYYYTAAAGGIARFQINQVMAAKGIDVLEVTETAGMGQSQDRLILQKFADQNKLDLFDAEERTDLFPDVEGWDSVEELFAAIVPVVATRRAQVRTTEFQPAALPLLVFNPKHGSLRESMKQIIEKFGDAGGTLMQIMRLAESKLKDEEGTTVLLLNAANDDMKLLRARAHMRVATDVAIELYHLALEYSGYVWDQNNMDVVRAHRQRLLRRCLEAADALEAHYD